MLLNVRLGPEEARIVRGLKRRKVNVSALVRRELVAAGTKLLKKKEALSERERVEKILRETPEPVRRGPPLDDRHAVREFIRKKLRRR